MVLDYYRFCITYSFHRLYVIFIYRHRDKTFIYIRSIHISKVSSINDKKLNQLSSKSIYYKIIIICILIIKVILNM